MHGLRLINFSGNPEASQHCNVSNNIDKIEHYSSAIKDTGACVPNIETEPKNKTSGINVSKEHETSLNQLFRLPPFGTNSNLKILRRPYKLNQQKNPNISLTKMYSDKIKDALKKVGKQKKKISKIIMKSPSRHVNNPYNNDKVKVIFTSQHWKTKRKSDKRINPRRSNLNIKSKSSFDRKESRNNCHGCCKSQLPEKAQHHKHKRKKKSVLNLPCNQKNCRNFRSDPTIKFSNVGPCKNCKQAARTPSLHYNLVDFSSDGKEKRRMNKRSILEVKANTSTTFKKRVNNICFCANKQVSVTPSSLALCLKGGGDTFEDKASQVFPKKTEKDKLRQIHFFRTSQIHKVCPKREHKKTHISVLLANTVVKYIIFGLSIIVWSPCIVITFLIWIVTYPMRPQEIIDTANNARQNRKDRKCRRQKNEFLTAIYESSKSFIKKITFFYESVFALLKTDEQKSKRCCKRGLSSSGVIKKQNSKKGPNPNKKYTLFYNTARGWVIKPIKSSNRIGLVETSEEKLTVTGRFGQSNILPEQACQVNFTFGQAQGKGYRKKSKFSLQSLKMTQAFYNKEQTFRSKQKNKKSIETQAQVNCDKPSDPSILQDNVDSNVVISNTCDVQTNFLDSSRPDIPVYATLQSRKCVKFDTKYPICDPCNKPPHPIKRYFCSNNVSTDENLKKTNSVKILRKIKPQQNPPKYIKVKKYDKDSNKEVMKQHIPRQPIPRREYKEYKEKETIRQNIPKRYVNVRGNYPKRSTKKSISTRSKFRSNIRKSRGKWFKNASFGSRFRKKISNMIDDAEKNIWNYDKCETLYVQTLRRRPCYWIFRRAPSFYPYFMIYYKFYESLVHGALIIMTACIWCPIFFWCYCCAMLLCRCL